MTLEIFYMLVVAGLTSWWWFRRGVKKDSEFRKTLDDLLKRQDAAEESTRQRLLNQRNEARDELAEVKERLKEAQSALGYLGGIAFPGEDHPSEKIRSRLEDAYLRRGEFLKGYHKLVEPFFLPDSQKTFEEYVAFPDTHREDYEKRMALEEEVEELENALRVLVDEPERAKFFTL